MAYLLDSNVFIQAKNLHYGFDFCPAFWQWLQQENDHGIVFSVDKVGFELEAGDDQLAQWAQDRRDVFFRAPDTSTLTGLAALSEWVTGQGYEAAAVNTFLQVADCYLVAHALAHSLVVVTHEKPEATVRKVKIPNACIGLKIRFMNPFEMLRREHARFVLGRSRDRVNPE